MLPMDIQHPRLALWCAALLALPSAALAQDPILLARSAGGDAFYYSALDTTGGVKSVRTSLVYASPLAVGDLKNVLSSVSTEQIDCTRLTRSTTRVELYDNPAARGTPLWSKDFTVAEKPPLAIERAASTASSILFRAVCAVAPAVTQATPTPAAARTVATDIAPASAHVPANAQKGSATESGAMMSAQPTAPVAAQALTPVFPPATQTDAVKPASPGTGTLVGGGAPPAAPPNPAGSAVPASTGAMEDYHPFPGLRMTLGMMGKFAEYVYFNDEDFGLLVDTFGKIKRGREKITLDGKAHPLVDEAFKRVQIRAGQYRDQLQGKKDFLSVGQFRTLELPKLQQGVVGGFRAELYQHVPSGEKILVFRGTESALDWLSNLWTGVDLLSIEAPHYQAAYNLVSALRKRGDAPLVVGHSLGGGMAQYVGFKFGLKVVGFNSAPLPERYFQEGAGATLDSIRLYSAVEYPEYPSPNPSPGYPDPVSIRVANSASAINGLFAGYEPIKAHQSLTRPICVKSIPEPFYTESERQFHLAMANKALSMGVVSMVVGGILPKAKPVAADMAIVAEVKHMVNDGLSDPVWLPDSNSRRDSNIAQAARNEVVEVAVGLYKSIGGAANIMKGGYKIAVGNSWGDILSGAGSMAAASGKVVAVDMLITRFLQPHSMARLNRGLRTVSTEDVFNAKPAAADCETTVIAKYP